MTKSNEWSLIKQNYCTDNYLNYGRNLNKDCVLCGIIVLMSNSSVLDGFVPM